MFTLSPSSLPHHNPFFRDQFIIQIFVSTAQQSEIIHLLCSLASDAVQINQALICGPYLLSSFEGTCSVVLTFYVSILQVFFLSSCLFHLLHSICIHFRCIVELLFQLSIGYQPNTTPLFSEGHFYCFSQSQTQLP